MQMHKREQQQQQQQHEYNLGELEDNKWAWMCVNKK